MKLSIYQAVLQTYAKQQGITLELALETAIRQSKGKTDAKGQIRRYEDVYRELKQVMTDTA